MLVSVLILLTGSVCSVFRPDDSVIYRRSEPHFLLFAARPDHNLQLIIYCQKIGHVAAVVAIPAVDSKVVQ